MDVRKNIHQVYIETTPEASYFALCSTKCQKGTKPAHKRGIVKAFSWRSRSRLIKKLSQVKRSRIPFFVTLTFGKQYPLDAKALKYLLHRFFLQLKRVKGFENMGVIWKLEYQRRGAPHFHLFLYGVELERAREIIPQCWYFWAGYGDNNVLLWHKGLLGNDHCVQLLKSIHGVFFYAAKYFSKLSDDDTKSSGRYWGVVGSVPFAAMVSVPISMRAALTLRREYLAKINSDPRVRFSNKRKKLMYFGFSMITEDGSFFRRAVLLDMQKPDDLSIHNMPLHFSEMSADRFALDDVC